MSDEVCGVVHPEKSSLPAGINDRSSGDVAFLLDDGSSVVCHSSVIPGEMGEVCAQQRTIELRNTNREALEKLIDFFYGNELVILRSNIEDIYAVAILFKVTSVMCACWTITMGTHTHVTILNSEWTKTTAGIDALARVFELEATTKSAMRQTPDVVKNLITSPYLILRSEDELCTFLLKYHAKNPSVESVSLFHYVLAENLSSELCEQIFTDADKQIVKILAKRRFLASEMNEDTSRRYKQRSLLECFSDLIENNILLTETI